MARPLKEINANEFEKLCKLLCTESEICAWFGVTDKTLSGWCVRTYGEGFSETYKKKSQAGKIAIRRYQFQLAERSATMAIFLGKNYLGQKDYEEVGVSSGSMAALIDGLREKPNDLHTEATGADGAMEDEQAPAD